MDFPELPNSIGMFTAEQMRRYLLADRVKRCEDTLTEWQAGRKSILACLRQEGLTLIKYGNNQYGLAPTLEVIAQ